MVRTAACGLVAGLVAAGCHAPADPPRRANFFAALRADTDSALADGAVVRTGLIDLPPGDPFLTSELWAAAGKPLPHETAVLLARNGLRVGVLTGHTPPRFDALTRSDATFLHGMERTFKAGVPRVVPVNGPLETTTLSVAADLAADPEERTFAAAECGLSVTARPGGAGRVTLTVEPAIQHGMKEQFLTAAADGTGFARTDHKPRAEFPPLAFTVTVAAGDHLVIGPTADPDGTVGGAFFTAVEGGRARRRVLVVRADAGR